MPELPEVETIVRGLREDVAGREIAGVAVRRERSVEGDRAALDRAVGRTVLGARRRGKVALLDLGPRGGGADLILAFHLRMTGRLFTPESLAARGESAPEPGPHTHLIFTFADGGRLFFEDARTFGSCRVCAPGTLCDWPFYDSLGPEPLETAPDVLAARAAGRNARIKSLLLDQRVVAGIGNIYADESLHRAGIRPDATAARLGTARLTRLFAAVREVLREAIDACGSSISDYRDARGDVGHFQNKFRVYGRAGQPCPACATRLRSAKVAGRTTTWCPKCQKP
ncbi:MAG: bifunctional DNA-formamidopyrimidine glycosylase/DNA-(apurinic or apyrimidinic site) lyase [Desulfovibrionaceae bacterium]|nr:bifunctional DNA-formamidopyrimidine glycosylase/DNA-(apurinic or apyrimidinic site) lyase [Desulfovibrionaceae bacterium]